MDARREFLRKRLVDQALARDAAQADEGGCDNGNRKMRFAFRASALVPEVTVRFVADLKADRTEALGQFTADLVGYGHDSQVIGDRVAALSSDAGFSPLANIGQKPAEIFDNMMH